MIDYIIFISIKIALFLLDYEPSMRCRDLEFCDT